MRSFLSWIDRRHLISVRAGMQYITVWMTWEVTRWAFVFASSSKLPGLELAAVISAVTVPFCALQAMVFKQYMEDKSG